MIKETLSDRLILLTLKSGTTEERSTKGNRLTQNIGYRLIYVDQWSRENLLRWAEHEAEEANAVITDIKVI